jgi:hypothetical protein
MATLIESWGGSNSNVYANLTEVHSYLTTALFEYAAWTDATAQREAAILMATVQIDRMHYVGDKFYSTQKLKFPRALPGRSNGWTNFIETEIGTPFSTLQSQMQDDVKRATAYQALHICRQGGRDLDAERIAAGIRSYSEQVGPVKEFAQYGGVTSGQVSTQRLCPDAMDILGRWRTSRPIYRR